jgi:CHAT domain-containing protein/Tfp pilus assembly protein PilF
MQPTHRGLLGSVILVCLLLSSVSAQDESRTRPSAADDAALRALVEEFYGSYAKKDLDSFLQLWSAKAPELAARRETMQKLFADNEKIEVKDLVIRQMAVEGEKAKLRVELEISAIEVKTSKPAAGLGKMMRALEGVKEGVAWKVWHEASAEEDLANALALLKTEAEQSALLTAEKTLVTERLVREINRQGNSFNSRGDYPQALVRFRLAQKIAEQIGERAALAATLTGIGSVYSNQSNYPQALEYFQKSLALRETLEDKAGMASTLLGIGIVDYNQGNYTQALEHYRKSLTLVETIGDKTGMLRALNNMGNVYSNQGDYAQAVEYYQKSVALSEVLGDKNGIARTLNNMGSIHLRRGDYAQALEHYHKSLAIKEASGDKDGIARTLNNIGLVLLRQGNYAPALEYYQKSLALREALGDKTGVVFTLNSIGNVHADQGNYAQALAHYHKGLALSEALGNKDGIALILGNIGNVHFLQSNYAPALECYQKSLAINEAVGDKASIALMLTNIGEVLRQQGNHAPALEHYQKGLALYEALGNKDGTAHTLYNIGVDHYRQGNMAQALEYFQKSLVQMTALGDKDGIANTLTDMGRTYRANNQLTQAREAFEKAITTIETLRGQVAGGEQDQQHFFEDKLASYHSIVELLVEQKQFGAALGYAERAKARVLLDVLHSGRINVNKAMTAAEQEQERGFNNRLISLNTQISRENQRSQPETARLNDLKAQLQKARLDYEAFQTSLYAAHPELKAQRGEVEPLTPDQVRALLPDPRSALLEYVVTDDRTYLFALTGNELKVYPLTLKQKELGARVAQFRETVASGSPGFREPARELYDLLLKPAAAQLQGRTSLIIVPDGALWELPFQILQPGPNRYLIEDAAIAHAPSLTALREMNKLRERKQEAASSPTLLAFANPALGKQTITRVKSVLMDEKLDPLPEAERQVNAIKQIYGAPKTKVYIGAEAREERAKAEAGSYRILHFATHGILNDSSPMYSQLLLAQSEADTNEDGLLEAWEIMKLNLNADLVVLSACDTARGRVGAGEGMIGLSWAFFVAGSPTSVLSQWKVDSASTTELMMEFHRQLKAQMANSAGSFSAARALRQAELKLLRNDQYRHPFYWAGFVVTGKGF